MEMYISKSEPLESVKRVKRKWATTGRTDLGFIVLGARMTVVMQTPQMAWLALVQPARQPGHDARRLPSLGVGLPGMAGGCKLVGQQNLIPFPLQS